MITFAINMEPWRLSWRRDCAGWFTVAELESLATCLGRGGAGVWGKLDAVLRDHEPAGVFLDWFWADRPGRSGALLAEVSRSCATRLQGGRDVSLPGTLPAEQFVRLRSALTHSLRAEICGRKHAAAV